MPRREDERWAAERENAPRTCPACQRSGRYYYNEKFRCWTCGWCERSFSAPKPENKGAYRPPSYEPPGKYFGDEGEWAWAKEQRRPAPRRPRQKANIGRWFLALVGAFFLVGGLTYFPSFAQFFSRIGIENDAFVQSIELPLEIFGGFLLFLALFVKRPSKAVKVSIFLLLIVLSILFVWHTPTLKGQVADVLNSWRQSVATTSPTPSPAPAPKLQALALYMLALINRDRQEAGLAPVTLGTNTAAQEHAEGRLANDYLSHWGVDGMKPYMRYTLAGGFNYEAENGFVTRTVWTSGKNPFYKRDPKEMLEEAEKSLMTSPGHKRNILNKWHKKVNIGIAYNNESLHLVQQFEGDYIEFNRSPTLSGNILTMAGMVSLGAIDAVALYYDPLPQPLIREQLEAPHDYSYSLGEAAGRILPPLPPGWFYTDLASNDAQATKWEVGPNGSFIIEADVSPLLKKGSGVYTVVIWAQVGNESINLTNFSIFVGAGR